MLLNSYRLNKLNNSIFYFKLIRASSFYFTKRFTIFFAIFLALEEGSIRPQPSLGYFRPPLDY